MIARPTYTTNAVTHSRLLGSWGWRANTTTSMNNTASVTPRVIAHSIADTFTRKTSGRRTTPEVSSATASGPRYRKADRRPTW